MLDSIKMIGKAKRADFRLMAENVRSQEKKPAVLLRIIFDFDKGEVNLDEKSYQKRLAEEYLFIGHTFAAAREEVARLTIRDIKYFPQTITNLRKRIEGIKICQELIDALRKIETTFLTADKVELWKKRFDEQLREKRQDYQVMLYTICLRENGRLRELATEQAYIDALPYLTLSAAKEGKTISGRCFLCGKEGDVLVDPQFEGGSILKLYVIDQPGFLSGISRDKRSLSRSFALCPDCRWDLILGEKYISGELSFPIGTFYAYLIPRIEINGVSDINKVLGAVREDFERVRTYTALEEIRQFEQNIERYSDSPDSWYSLSVLFGKKQQAHFEFYGMIQEVPVTNLKRLRDEQNSIARRATEFWKNDEQKVWTLTLEAISRLIPLRKDTERRPLIEIFEALLKGETYPEGTLVMHAVNFARIHRFESYTGYTITRPKNSDIEMVVGMLRFNYLLKLFNAGERMTTEGSSVTPIDVDESMQKWIIEMGYDGRKTALFMLGVLVGRLGNEQYKKGGGNKPVLEKIDFKGMKQERVIRLANDVLKSLKDYKILGYNERLYYETLRLLNKHIQQIEKGDPEENLFYILTGYSFATYSFIRGVASV